MIKRNIICFYILILFMKLLYSESVFIQIPTFLKTDHIEKEFRIDIFDGLIKSIYMDAKLDLSINYNEGTLEFFEPTNNELIKIQYTDNTIVVEKENEIKTYNCGDNLLVLQDNLMFFLEDKFYELFLGNKIKTNSYLKTDSKIVIFFYDYFGDNEYARFRTTGIIDRTEIITNSIKDLINYFIIFEYDKTLLKAMIPLLFYSNEEIDNKIPSLYDKGSCEYLSTAYLIENGIHYSPKNLSTLEGLPWASADGYGINDTITINIYNNSLTSLLIQNGFLEKEKPHLFLNNSRVKTIKVRNNELNIEKDFELWDQKAPQIINLSKFIDSSAAINVLDIIILDVFKGSKYQDLCINALIPYK